MGGEGNNNKIIWTNFSKDLEKGIVQNKQNPTKYRIYVLPIHIDMIEHCIYLYLF